MFKYLFSLMKIFKIWRRKPWAWKAWRFSKTWNIFSSFGLISEVSAFRQSNRDYQYVDAVNDMWDPTRTHIGGQSSTSPSIASFCNGPSSLHAPPFASSSLCSCTPHAQYPPSFSSTHILPTGFSVNPCCHAFRLLKFLNQRLKILMGFRC